jgi:hypothetical protein
MKQPFFAAIMAATMVLSACNSNPSSDSHAGHDMAPEKKDSLAHASAGDVKEMKTISAVFSTVDPKANASIREIVDHYLHIKNALAGDNAGEAGKGAKAMTEAIGKLDKSLLTAEQKSAYDKIEAGLKTHASQIAQSGTDIKIQRSHFLQLSESAYELVKQFGGGRPLYHDHCPMARENQGAMWISELKEVRNPYFGEQMLTCGTVEEVIQ